MYEQGLPVKVEASLDVVLWASGEICQPHKYSEYLLGLPIDILDYTLLFMAIIYVDRCYMLSYFIMANISLILSWLQRPLTLCALQRFSFG